MVNGPPSVSPDGRFAAWLRSGDQSPEIVLYDMTSRLELSRRRVGVGRCRSFTWTHVPGTGIALSDEDGAENTRLHRVNLETGEWTALGGPGTSRTSIAGLSARRPGEVLVASSGSDVSSRDYRILSLDGRESTTILRDSGAAAVYFDLDFRPRLTETVRADGGRELAREDPARGRAFLSVPHEHSLTTRLVGFSTDGDRVFFVLPHGDGVRLAALSCAGDASASAGKTLAAVEGGDFARILFADDTGEPDLVEIERARRHCVPLTARWVAAVESLRRRLGTEPVVLERRSDDRVWLVAAYQPHRDVQYFGYEPGSDDLWLISEAQPGGPVWPVKCESPWMPFRDGKRAVAYVSRPEQAGDQMLPTVLLAHGGPWRRSRWEYDERRAWLAAQGYTVVEPNFRGSTGFGSAWVNAGDRQWGAAMQDDLEDALDWAVSRGLADPDRIALVGGSYGGYAVLQLAATTRRRVRCVVATSPLTDLVSFLEKPPDFWSTALPMLHRRVGDPGDPGQRARLSALSPVSNVTGFRCPVLLVHGARDSRIPVAGVTRMFMELARADREASLALFPDEGHEVMTTRNQRLLRSLLGGYLAASLKDQDGETWPNDRELKLFHTPRASARGGASLGIGHGATSNSQ